MSTDSEQLRRNLVQRHRGALLTPLAEQLEDGEHGFRDKVAHDLRQGVLPQGSGLDIMVKILLEEEEKRITELIEKVRGV